jgi:multiple sugar transport system substrate-binding protein
MSTEDAFAYCPLLYGYSNYARPANEAARSGKNQSGGHLIRFANISALGTNGPVGSTIGGTGMAVSAASKHVEAALAFAFFVCSADVQRGVYFESGGQPGNAVAWDDPAVNAASSNFFADTRQTLEHAYLRPRHDGYMAFQARGGDLVHAHLSGHASAEQTVNELNQAFRESFLRATL